ncbi:MAG TPA: GNAT family N-acetyltransferase [Microbacteriaceae bacterium]|nr:GNAT family N-acetyltransferase [Microbacteriaceae bacterium]
MPHEPMTMIRSARLDLVLVTERELKTGTLEDRPFANPHGVYSNEPLPRANRAADVASNPTHISWYYRIMVDRARNLAVGSISFHAAPDASGMAEIGLGVAEAERGKGFAGEAVRAMWDWASTQEGVRRLRYTVSPTNAPSIALIHRLDVPEIGVQIDEEDGPELIFETTVEAWKAGRRLETE